jgi:hypothetical protein
MKKILSITAIALFVSCKKNSNNNNQTYCYECDISSFGSGDYHDVGCYTQSNWDTLTITVKDSLGARPLNKSRCRKK